MEIQASELWHTGQWQITVPVGTVSRYASVSINDFVFYDCDTILREHCARILHSDARFQCIVHYRRNLTVAIAVYQRSQPK
jgi:hypothetical protein